jgi:dienelactone hydrolase
MKMPTNTKSWIQGAVVGGIAVAIVGFTWGGWVTGGTAVKNSVTASHDAVVAALAPICVERFRGQTDVVLRTADLVKINSWERRSVIEKAGFATMPGSNTADSDVARACAEILAAPAALK